MQTLRGAQASDFQSYCIVRAVVELFRLTDKPLEAEVSSHPLLRNGAEFGGAFRTHAEVGAPLGIFYVSRKVSVGDLVAVCTVHSLAFTFM